ncbi:MAG: flavodoxin family protein [Clostridia bacterium]|nr:flavodoxin family protein [Clostridia bacterium]
MKVLMINGSPHPHGCTYTALHEVEKELNAAGIETEIVNLGVGPLYSCAACNMCRNGGKGRCVRDDMVNVILEKAETADGFIFASPVHIASASGAISAVMDRAFYANSAVFRQKPGAAVVSARRAGTTATFDQLNKYFTINQMPIVSSQYWNMVHGYTPEDVMQDKEGMQTMRTLGRNMAWLLKCIELGKQNGIEAPAQELPKLATDFIR